MRDYHGVDPMTVPAGEYAAYCASLDYPDFSKGGIVPDFTGGIIPDFTGIAPDFN